MYYHEPECHAEKLFAVFKVKATVMANIIKIQLYTIASKLADPFATKLGLMVHYYLQECLVKKIGLLC